MEIPHTITFSHTLPFIVGSGRYKAVGELPAHEHDVTCSNNGLHQHKIDIYNDEGRDAPYVAGAAGGIKGSPSTSETGNHSHTISINKTGGNFAHNNMQPFLSVYMWYRID